MGGKDAILVAEDADLDAAAAGICASAFGFQGQKCSACSRAIVADAVHDALLDKLLANIRQIRVGPPEDFSAAMGPVIHRQAMEKILAYIALGQAEGRLRLGGERLRGPVYDSGWYVAPTVFSDVAPRARLAQEEIFGPVLAVIRCRDFVQGLEFANDSEYGLTGAVYSRDPAKLARAAQEFQVGNLYLNRKCTGAMVGSHPFGGFNLSGTDSKAGGPDYLLLFTQAQSIAEKLTEKK
jgi:1-pyrroline-5-carboxylate dehydrogenase